MTVRAYFRCLMSGILLWGDPSAASEVSFNCRFLIGSGGAESEVDAVIVDVQNNRMQFLASGRGAQWSYASEIADTRIEYHAGGKVVMTSIRVGVPSFSNLNLANGHLVWVHQIPDQPIVYNEFLCVPQEVAFSN